MYDSRYVLLIAFLMFINLAYMHYEVYFSRNHFPGVKPYYSPFIFICFDVLVTVSVFSVLSLRNRKWSYALSYLFLLGIAVVNIGYSRFFHQYISLGAFSEFKNFKGTWWLQYVSDGFRWTDLILLFSALLAVYGVCKLKNDVKKVNFVNLLVAVILMLSFHGIWGRKHLCNISAHEYKNLSMWWDLNVGASFQRGFIYDSDATIVNNGIIRTQVICNILAGKHGISLSQKEIKRIDAYVEEKNKREGEIIDSCVVEQGKPDITFILVESFMSFAVNEKIGDKEIMPNLNSMIREGCYANLSMISNKGAGESSDAQVSYLTGILPLKEEVSVTHIIHNEVISLPQLLRSEKGYNTYMTVPTEAGFWHQEEANIKYGITNMTALGAWVNDSLVFDSAMKQIPQLKSPYFNLLLTISMHGLYEKDNLQQIAFPFKLPQSYSKEYKNYLKRCYYTDAQIGRYINKLKSSGKYENNLIIITSDHEVKENSLAMDCLRNKNELPFILVNTKANTVNTARRAMRQVDVYASLVDLLGLKTKWRGIGHSIFRNGQYLSPDSTAYQISQQIILGNYFKYTSKMW